MTTHSHNTPEGTTRGVRGPYRTGVRRREQIIDTAVQVFGQHGYVGGSLRKIAESVGVTPAAVISLFGSKEGLFTAVLDRSDRENSANRLTGATGLQFLREFADIVNRNVQNRGMVELLLTVAAEATYPEHPARPFMTDRYQGVVAKIAKALREAAEDGEISAMSDEEIESEARGFVALMDGLELQWLLDPSMDLVGIHGRLFEATVERWQCGRAPAPQPEG